MTLSIVLILSTVLLSIIAAELFPLVVGLVAGYYSVKTIKKVV